MEREIPSAGYFVLDGVQYELHYSLHDELVKSGALYYDYRTGDYSLSPDHWFTFKEVASLVSGADYLSHETHGVG